MKSLFLNLITNALKYSDGKEIKMKLFKTEQKILFKITNETENTALDTEQIWIPYYVGEQSRNKKMSGTGLGLSIVKKICETQRYEIKCLKENGRITFSVSLPGVCTF